MSDLISPDTALPSTARVPTSPPPTSPPPPPPPPTSPPPRPTSTPTPTPTPTSTPAPVSASAPAPTLANSNDAAATARRIITVRAWNDPVVDDCGHDPRSAYVETFWLGVLGPTATWLLRRFATGLEAAPEGFDLDLATTAGEMGLSYRSGRSSAFTKALQRCVMFGLAHQLPEDGLAVRRRIPSVAHRHLRRMPEALQRRHAEWETEAVTLDELSRAHHLALAMIEIGDDAGLVEIQLRSLGVSRAVAAGVADNVSRLAPTSPASA